MMLVLNLLPPALLIAAVFASVWRRNAWIVVWAVLAFAGYMQLQPSYMPKGGVTRSANPDPEQTDAGIESRNSRPDTLQERDRRMRDTVKQGLDFAR